MSKAQLVITAVVLENRSKSEVARDYDVSRQWVQQLVRRYQTEGATAFEPRSRRPHTNARAVGPELEDRIVRLRKTLSRRGLDAADPSVTKVLAVLTIWRILTRRGFVIPQPHKRSRSSWKRFCAELPNHCWQADVTHWHLADGGGVEILNILYDHSPLPIASLARAQYRRPRPAACS
jgi:transposase